MGGISETFNVKAVSYMIASPDEVAVALTDVNTRKLWDPSLKTIERVGAKNSNTFKITYLQSSSAINE